MTEPRTQPLELPGAPLTYDVAEAKSESTAPVLLMIRSPMDATGFTMLASHFADRTVVTYDPRAVARSPRDDGVTAATPDEHAEDLHQLISELDAAFTSDRDRLHRTSQATLRIQPPSTSQPRMTAAGITRCRART